MLSSQHDFRSVDGMLTLVLASTGAYADGGANAGDDLKACKGLPARAKAEAISDDAVCVAGKFSTATTYSGQASRAR